MKPTTILLSLFIAIAAAAPSIPVVVDKRTADAITPGLEARKISTSAPQEDVKKKRDAEAQGCRLINACI
ncbi:hypothetical protein N0V85_006252 [Neurospora sp. IMI 360204]|nr:hypothetical protein N0V85_006252 [Neurospora sp. IMI 360204]